MARNLFALNEAKLVSVAIGARPTLAADGVSIEDWLENAQFCGPLAAVFLEGSAAATVTSPAGGDSGVELWGYRLNKWWLIAELRDGRDVAVDVGIGYSQSVNVIGVFQRLAVAGVVSAGAGTAHLAPIEAWS